MFPSKRTRPTSRPPAGWWQGDVTLCHPQDTTSHPTLDQNVSPRHRTPHCLQITENPIRTNTPQHELFRISSFLPCCLNHLLFLPQSLTSPVMFQAHNKPRWCMNFLVCSSHPRLFPLGLACLSVTISPHPSACIPLRCRTEDAPAHWTRRGGTKVQLNLCPLSSTSFSLVVFSLEESSNST